MRSISDRPKFLLMLLSALVCMSVHPCWMNNSEGIARADEITIKRDDGTEETFSLSQDLIEKAVMMAVRFSPFVLPSWEGKVVEITRADEIRVKKNDGTVENVRLYGIDAPIDPNPFGKEAAMYTARRVLGKTVKVQPLLLPDPWSRTIAWVWVDGESLNREMLKNGIAWWFRKYVPWEKELAQLEEEARAAQVGLWATPSPVPPWEAQALPSSQSAAPEAESTTIGRRGAAREKVQSEGDASKKLFGDAGSVRQKLLKSTDPEEKE